MAASASSPDVRTCEEHNLHYDANQQPGCVLCRRSAPTPPPGRIGTWMAACVLLVGGGGAGWLLFTPSAPRDSASAAQAAKPSVEQAETDPAHEGLDDVDDGRKPSAPPPRGADVLPEPAETLVLTPEGTHPEGGWPGIVALHGLGASGARLEGLAQWLRRAGLAALVPTGPVPLSEAGRYAWPDPAATAAYVDRTVERSRARVPLQPCPLITGFSQGAARALQLAARSDSKFCGVFAMSAVGKAPRPEAPRPVPAFLLVGSDDAAARRMAKAVEQRWQSAGWPVRVVHYDGGHKPPDDWSRHLEPALDFLR